MTDPLYLLMIKPANTEGLFHVKVSEPWNDLIKTVNMPADIVRMLPPVLQYNRNHGPEEKRVSAGPYRQVDIGKSGCL